MTFITWYHNLIHEKCVRRQKYVHAAVGEGHGVRVAGHALLFAVVGAGGRSHGVTRVDIVRVDGLPAGCVSGKERRERNTRNEMKNEPNE